MATIDPKTGLPITDVSNAAIPTSALSTPQTPIKVASVADQTPIYNAAITTGTGQTQQALDLAQKQADELAAQNKYVEGSNTLSALQSQVSGKAADQASAYAQTGGVNDLYKQLSQLNVEAQGLQRQTLANPLQQQEAAIGTGRVQGQVESITAQNQRQIALKALDLGQRAAIAQGNYDVAKNLADQQIEAKYAGLDAQIEAQKTNLQLVRDRLTDAQKKAADARLEVIKKQEKDRDERIANEKAISDMLIEASPVAPPDILARATDVKNKGGSAIQVAAALGKYGGDYLKNELLKEQLKKTRAETAKLDSEASVAQATQKTPEVNAWVKNINEGKAKLSDVPQKLKSAVSLGLSTGIASNPAKLQDYRDKLGLINNIESSGALTSVVGPSALGRIGYTFNRATGEAQDFTAKVDQLTKGLTLQNLIDAKSKGATFGALSEGEMKLLSDSATRLNSFRKEDSGGNIYYDVNEQGFKDALDEVKKYTQMAYEREGGVPNSIVPTGVSSSAASYAQSTMGTLNNVNNQVNTQQSYGGYDTGIK